MAKKQHFSFNATATIAADPEFSVTQSGTAMLRLRLVSNQSRKVKDEWTTVPFWWRAVLWGKPAERLQKVLCKSMDIFAKGEVHTREYKNRDGNMVKEPEFALDPDIEIVSWPRESRGAPSAPEPPRAGDDSIEPPPENDDPSAGLGDIDTGDLPF